MRTNGGGQTKIITLSEANKQLAENGNKTTNGAKIQ